MKLSRYLKRNAKLVSVLWTFFLGGGAIICMKKDTSILLPSPVNPRYFICFAYAFLLRAMKRACLPSFAVRHFYTFGNCECRLQCRISECDWTEAENALLEPRDFELRVGQH